MRASRLLSLLLLLQTRGRMTAAQLAAELEVSVRTVYRDVADLGAAGVPLYGEAGAEGGYQLLAGYRTRLTGLTAAEAQVVLLGGLPGPAAQLGLGEAFAAAQLKLLAALPPDLRRRAEHISQRFHLDALSWYRSAEDTTHLAAVADAVWHQRVLRMHYRRWAAPTDVIRTVEPLGLVLKAGSWYVVARTDASVRTYRVAAILRLDVLDTRFERPRDFDLTEHWHAYLADFDVRRYRGEAVVRLSPRGVERLGVPPGLPDTDGWVRVALPIETLDNAVSELLRLGTDVEVLGPPQLRDRMAAVARDLNRTYAVPLSAAESPPVRHTA